MNELRDFLKARLPEYMVPVAFIKLAAMPLTPSGKISRRSLPAPDVSDLASSTTFVAPETPTEELLAAIWTEVLGLEQVGIHDNFFVLGGHSLKATQVISRIRAVLSQEVSVRNVFEFPTIAELGKAIETKGVRVKSTCHCPGVKGDSITVILCSRKTVVPQSTGK